MIKISLVVLFACFALSMKIEEHRFYDEGESSHHSKDHRTPPSESNSDEDGFTKNIFDQSSRRHRSFGNGQILRKILNQAFQGEGGHHSGLDQDQSDLHIGHSHHPSDSRKADDEFDGKHKNYQAKDQEREDRKEAQDSEPRQKQEVENQIKRESDQERDAQNNQKEKIKFNTNSTTAEGNQQSNSNTSQTPISSGNPDQKPAPEQVDEPENRIVSAKVKTPVQNSTTTDKQ